MFTTLSSSISFIRRSGLRGDLPLNWDFPDPYDTEAFRLVGVVTPINIVNTVRGQYTHMNTYVV